ncbi:MAG TPA: phenylalanine--tRNA ligase subunit beta [Kofleriaceae bacterium]|nr:phenylalanine--tRNA ligase subunit beta [Kofleriaceae bacterium]
MRAVWSWLLELAELEREVGADEGAALLTGAGLEVESIERLGGDFSGVVVAEVVAAERHPKADRLTVVDVIDRAGGPATRVVCGAPNVPPPGGRVLWARPGARLPGEGRPIEISKRALKGVESAGMLCSEKELGIGDDASGIAVLAGDEARAAPGTSAQEALRLVDAVLEVSAPANRPDTLGHLGLARELCALVGGRLAPGDVDLSPVVDRELQAGRMAAIDIDDPVGCPRYVARVIDRLSLATSPGWMRRRLLAVGVRPISNLVDVTNYVLFELGHPLHAFDYRRVAEGRIRVRRARAGERLTTLDGQERTLVAGDLLICDARGPVALAGVMGGRDSEVADDTTRVLLEAAAFESVSVRRTARRLGLHSEASQRFERGVDPNGAERASRRAARLLAELGGGRVAEGVVDAYPRPPAREWIRMRASRASSLAGIAIGREVATEALSRLGLEVEAGAGDELRVASASFRPDLGREVDLIEEVLRLRGYHQLPATLPPLAAPPAGVTEGKPGAVRRVLTGLGWNEAITFGFTSPARIRALRLAPDDPRLRMVALRNPMSVDQSVMRTSLLPNLLSAVARNLKHDVNDVWLFEVGSVFLPRSDTDGELPDEPARVAGILCGRRPGWLGPGAAVDFYDAKGAVERVIAELTAAETGAVRFEPARDVPYLHPGVAARVVTTDGAVLGEIGEVHPEVRATFEIAPPCFVFDLDLARLPEPAPRQMRAVPRYPAITRDISLFVPADVPAAGVGDLIAERSDPLIEQVRVLEEYRDPERVPAGQKGLLWSITYRSSERTLTDGEVDERHEALVSHLVEKLAATRR